MEPVERFEPSSGPISAGKTMELAAAGDAIVVGVERVLPEWVESRVALVADAWGRLGPDARAALADRARAAGAEAGARVGAALRSLFVLPPAEQRTTPLEIVRSAVRDVTIVLVAAGIPPVERDAFDERAFPDDRYGVVPSSLADLGDETLGPLQLAWGMAKARALRAEPP